MNERPDDASSPTNLIVDRDLSSKRVSTADKSQQEPNRTSLVNDGTIVRLGSKTPDPTLSRLARARNHVVKLNPQRVSVSRSQSPLQISDASPSETPTNLLRNRRRLTNEGGQSALSEVQISRMSSTQFGVGDSADIMLRQGSFDNSYCQEYNNGQKGLNQSPNLDYYAGQGILEEDPELANTLRDLSRIENKRGEEAKVEDNSWIFADEEYKEKYELPQFGNLNASQTMNSHVPLNRSSGQLARGPRNSRTESPRESPGRSRPTEQDRLNIQHTFRNETQEINIRPSSNRNRNRTQNQENRGTGRVQATVPATTITTTAATINNAQQGNPAQQQQQRLLPEFEVKVYIRKCLVLFITLFFFSVLLVLCVKKYIPIRPLTVPLYCYFIYMTIENVYCGCYTRDLLNWQRRDHRLHILGPISCIIAIIMADMKRAGVLSYSVYGVIPMSISTLVYQLFSKAPSHTKSLLLAFKLAYSIQALLITSKLDDSFDIDWVYILLPSLGFLSIMDTSFLIHSIMLLVLSIGVLTGQYQEQSMSNKLQLIGILWHFGYTGLSAIGTVGIIGAISGLDPDGDVTMMFIAGLVGIGVNLFMVIYTIWVFKPLVEFFRIFYQDGGLIGSEAIPEALPRLPPTISFKVEKKNSYFVTLSSTYFLPLTKNLMHKNRSNIQKIKAIFKELRQGGDISKAANEKEDHMKQEKPIDTDTLHEYKRTLDKKLSKVLEISPRFSNSPTTVKTFTKLYTPRVEDSSPTKKKEANFEEVDPYQSKMALSAGNLDELIKQDVYSATKQRSEEENLCYLCYERPRDCVLMNCGHGGFCYECAIKAIKRKNECMECRGKVETIHKIDVESQLTSIIKTVESRKVVVVENQRPTAFRD